MEVAHEGRRNECMDNLACDLTLLFLFFFSEGNKSETCLFHTLNEMKHRCGLRSLVFVLFWQEGDRTSEAGGP